MRQTPSRPALRNFSKPIFPDETVPVTDTNDEQPENRQQVTFLITDLDQGGAENAMVELVTRLDSARWSSHVISLTSGGILSSKLEENGIPVESLGAKSFRDFPKCVWKVRRRLKELRPDILCTSLYHANIVGRLAAAMLSPRMRVFSGIRVAEKRSKFRLRVDRATDFLVDGHLCVSQDVLRFSYEVGKLPRQKLHVVPNGVDVDRFDLAEPIDWTTFDIPAEDDVLLYVGRLDVQKGLRDLLTALIPLLKQRPRLHLVLAGEGPLRTKLEQRVDMEQLTSRIHLVGHRDDIPSLMRGATLLVHPSHWEGAANVLLEAMAARLTIVCTDTEGSGELLSDGQFGRIVPIQDPDAFRDAVNDFLTAPEEQFKIAEESYHHVKKHFTWRRSVEIWEQAVQKRSES